MSNAFIDDEGKLHLPARVIPVPRTVSDAARGFLQSPVLSLDLSWPVLGDKSNGRVGDKTAWKDFIAERDAAWARLVADMPPFAGTRERHAVGGATLYELLPDDVPERNRQRAVLYVHGGAYVMGGGELSIRGAAAFATAMRCRVYSIDYRMPPEHPFPVGLNDTVDAWRFLLDRHDPKKAAITGPSAGGGLAASATLKIRDLGLAMPGAAVLVTPECDLTEIGDTFETNQDIDVVLKTRLTQPNLLYADGHDLRDPYISAVFGDFSKGYPPTALFSGTRDLFLSNTVILHRALRRVGIAAELHVFEGMPHGGFFGAPEDAESLAEQVAFLDRVLGV